MSDQRIGRRRLGPLFAAIVGVGTVSLAAMPVFGQGVATTPAASVPAAKVPAAYVLGPDDQILIRVTDAPEIGAAPQRIDANGDLRLPMIGRIHAAGLTVDEFEKALTLKLKTYLTNPDVQVITQELHNQSVTVLGAVSSPGVKEVRSRATLIEVLSLAGGPSASAGPTVRVIRRPEAGRIPLPEATVDVATGASTVDIDLQDLMAGRRPDKDIPILANDTVSVPAARLVYVLGNVGHAGSFPISRGTSVSVTEAVAASGGLNETADPDHARILRLDDTSLKRHEVPVDVKKILRGQANDVELVAGDILVIPDSTGKKVRNRTIDLLITSVVTAGVYLLIRR